MDRLVIVLPLVAVAVAVAFVVQRRPPAAPAQPVEHVAPSQLDRSDFGAPRQPWLVVAFTSATCATCADLSAKVAVLASDQVATVDCEFPRDREIHEKYGITAVPAVVIADVNGVVQRSFLGATPASHLWAAVAELRGDE